MGNMCVHKKSPMFTSRSNDVSLESVKRWKPGNLDRYSPNFSLLPMYLRNETICLSVLNRDRSQQLAVLVSDLTLFTKTQLVHTT